MVKPSVGSGPVPPTPDPRPRTGRLRALLPLRRGTAPGSTRGAAPRTLTVVATRLFAPEPTPAAFREEALAAALEASGDAVLVMTTIAPEDDGGLDRLRDISRFPVLRDAQGHVRGYASYMSFDVPLVLRILTARGLAVVVSEPPPTTGLAVMLACALRRVPFAFYAADVWSDATGTVPGVPWVVRTGLRAAEKLVWRRAGAVLAISPGVRDRIVELIGERPTIHEVGNGIDTDVFTPDGPRAPIPPASFVYAGTISEWHGAEIFLDAFARVRRTHPEAVLQFYSEGSEREAFARRVQEEGIDGVRFSAKLPAEQMAEVLRAANCALSSVLPGRGYDFAIPTKIYAATACGTPVVHSGVGTATEIVRENGLGWAVDHDADAVAAAMIEALEGRDRPTSEHLRRWTLDHASLAAAARRAATAVRSLAPGRR